MPTPHKNAQVIHAWADGKQIQIQMPSGIWRDLNISNPQFDSDNYRIKPEPQIIEGLISLPATSGHRHFLTNVSIYEIQCYKRCTITIHPDE